MENESEQSGYEPPSIVEVGSVREVTLGVRGPGSGRGRGRERGTGIVNGRANPPGLS